MSLILLLVLPQRGGVLVALASLILQLILLHSYYKYRYYSAAVFSSLSPGERRARVLAQLQLMYPAGKASYTSSLWPHTLVAEGLIH